MRRLVLAAGLLAALAASPAATWADPFGVDPLVTVSGGTSPFASCTADQTPTNLTGTNFADSELEPWVDANPTNPLNLVGGWQQDRWSDGGARGLAAGVSFDGGATWTKVVIPKISLCSGGTAANGGDFERATDPWVSFAPNGDVFFFSLAFDNSPPAGRPGGDGKNAMLVSKSADGGLTWSDPVPVILDTDPRFFNDKNAITADPELVNGRVHVYAVWDRLESSNGFVINPEKAIGAFKGPAFFTRTTDGGATWEPARAIYDPGGNNQTIGNQIVVLPDGTLVDVFDEILFARQNAGRAFINCNVALVRSTNKGVTWTRGQPIRAHALLTTGCRGNGVLDPEQPDPLTGEFPGLVRTADIVPQVAVDRNPASPGYGNLYLAWQDFRFTPSDPSNPYGTPVPGEGTRFDEIAFSKSTDGGFTWSPAIRINTPSGKPAFIPTIRVAADGTIGVSYYDFRNDTLGDAPLSTDVWLIHSHDQGATWGEEVRVTRQSFDMRRAAYARGWFVGDYVGLTAIGNHFKPFFVVTTSTDPDDVVSTTVGP